MDMWLMLWGCEGHWASTCIRALSPALEQKSSWTLPALGGDRPSQSRQDRERERNNQAKKQREEEGIFCPSVYFLTGTKPILTSCQNIFWSAARSFVGERCWHFYWVITFIWSGSRQDTGVVVLLGSACGWVWGELCSSLLAICQAQLSAMQLHTGMFIPQDAIHMKSSGACVPSFWILFNTFSLWSHKHFSMCIDLLI